MPEVICNRDDCKYNVDQVCTAKQIGIVDGQCVTRRKVKRENYEQLMRQPFKPNCRPAQGGYKSDRVTGVLR